MDTIKEKGQASLRAELTDGVITIANDSHKMYESLTSDKHIKEARTLFETEHN